MIIVVHSKVWSDHIRQVRNVMSRLRLFGLTINAKKCVWEVAEIQYLGYKVGRGKVQIPELRVRALREFIQLKTKKQLKSYFRNTWLLPKIHPRVFLHSTTPYRSH